MTNWCLGVRPDQRDMVDVAATATGRDSPTPRQAARSSILKKGLLSSEQVWEGAVRGGKSRREDGNGVEDSVRSGTSYIGAMARLGSVGGSGDGAGGDVSVRGGSGWTMRGRMSMMGRSTFNSDGSKVWRCRFTPL